MGKGESRPRTHFEKRSHHRTADAQLCTDRGQLPNAASKRALVAKRRRSAGLITATPSRARRGPSLGASNWFAYETAYSTTASTAPRARGPSAGSPCTPPGHNTAHNCSGAATPASPPRLGRHPGGGPGGGRGRTATPTPMPAGGGPGGGHGLGRSCLAPTTATTPAAGGRVGGAASVSLQRLHRQKEKPSSAGMPLCILASLMALRTATTRGG